MMTIIIRIFFFFYPSGPTIYYARNRGQTLFYEPRANDCKTAERGYSMVRGIQWPNRFVRIARKANPLANFFSPYFRKSSSSVLSYNKLVIMKKKRKTLENGFSNCSSTRIFVTPKFIFIRIYNIISTPSDCISNKIQNTLITIRDSNTSLLAFVYLFRYEIDTKHIILCFFSLCAFGRKMLYKRTKTLRGGPNTSAGRRRRCGTDECICQGKK